MRTLQCHYGISTLLCRVLICIFDVFDLIWNLGPFFINGPRFTPMTSEINQYFTPFIWPVSCDVTIMETLNCDISSWEHDREMVDHSLNHKFEGASYDYGYWYIKSILLSTCELGESLATFIIWTCFVVKSLHFLKESKYSSLFFPLLKNQRKISEKCSIKW